MESPSAGVLGSVVVPSTGVEAGAEESTGSDAIEGDGAVVEGPGGLNLSGRHLEDELRATSERLGSILNAVGDGITVQDAGGRLVWANQAAAETMGFASAAELLATEPVDVMARFDVLDQAGRPFPLTDLPGRRALAGEEPPEVLLRWRVRATGEERWSLVRARPVFAGNGRPGMAVNVFRDMTARQHTVEALRRSEERFAFLASASRALMDSSLDTVALARQVTGLAVPGLADWCAVWELDGEGAPRRLACRVAEFHGQAVADAMAAGPGPMATSPVWTAVREGRSVIVADLPSDEAAMPSDPAARELLTALGTRSVLAVPIRLDGAVAGAVLLASTAANRYDEVDLALAHDVARRTEQGLQIAKSYEAERRARQEAEAATARLELLSELGRVLGSSLDVDELLGALARTVVPSLADRCIVDVTSPGGEVHRLTVSHQARNDSSTIVVPVPGRAGSLGTITFATSGRPFDKDDVALAEEIGRRAGVAVDNARLFSERSAAAATLAQALLPETLPDVPGVELAARYRPAESGVGGDFYDVVPLDDGRWLLVIGDVCGKGADAASLTAMARHTLRTLARSEHHPGALLEAANRAMADQLPEGRFCTVAAATLETRNGGAVIDLAGAGHPVPLLVRHDGEVTAVGGGGVPLGVSDEVGVREESLLLGPGDALVLFTDGCVGEGADPMDVLGPRLGASAGASAARLAKVVEAVALDLEPGHPDDKAILTLRVLPAT